jgi:hypothetical protein
MDEVDPGEPLDPADEVVDAIGHRGLLRGPRLSETAE